MRLIVRNMVIDCFSMHTHHLLYGVLTQYLSPGPCLDVVDWWSSSRPVVADAIARVPFALFISVSCSSSVLDINAQSGRCRPVLALLCGLYALNLLYHPHVIYMSTNSVRVSHYIIV
eukprot:COSAG01_NODE_600_length_14996_cov_385.219434_2_plen_117_part_00